MAKYVKLSGLEHAAELAEQHPEVVAAIEEAVNSSTAPELDMIAFDALDALESENPLLLEELLRDHGLTAYLVGVVRRYRDEDAHLQKMVPKLLDAERMELRREYLIPPPSSRTRKGKLSAEAAKLAKRWKAEIEAASE